MISYIKDTLFGFFVMCVAFSYSIFMICQAAFGFYQENSSLFQMYSGVLCLIVLLYFFLNIKFIPFNVTTTLLLISFSFIYLYYITRFFYVEDNKTYNSMFLSMGVRFIPALLLGSIISFRPRILIQIKRGLLPFIILYTFTLANHVLNSSVGDNLNLTYNSEGLNYQTISYYSIFAFGFTMYLLTDSYKRIYRYILIVLALLQLFVTISAGGRGAFVLGIVFFLYFGKKIFSLKKLLQYIPLAVLVLSVVISVLGSDSQLLFGFNRIWDFFGNSNSIENDGRWIRYNLAIDAFYNSPLWGNGIGSVFYEVGFYSHNMFTDLLCEGGLLLVGAIVILFCMFYTKCRYLVILNSDYVIFVIIFLCSFVNLLFSGYYLSESGIWLALGFILTISFDRIYLYSLL